MNVSGVILDFRVRTIFSCNPPPKKTKKGVWVTFDPRRLKEASEETNRPVHPYKYNGRFILWAAGSLSSCPELLPNGQIFQGLQENPGEEQVWVSYPDQTPKVFPPLPFCISQRNLCQVLNLPLLVPREPSSPSAAVKPQGFLKRETVIISGKQTHSGCRPGCAGFLAPEVFPFSVEKAFLLLLGRQINLARIKNS